MIDTGKKRLFNSGNRKRIFSWLSAVLLTYLCLSFLRNLVAFYWHNIFVQDPYGDYAWGILFALLLSLVIVIFPFKYKYVVLLGWLFKLIIVFLFNYFFESHYATLDSFHYHGTALNYGGGFIPFQATANMYALTALLYKLTVPSYRLAQVFFAFIGFLAQYIFWLAISLFVHSYRKSILILLMLLPSLVFWSSNLGKDPLVLLFISIYCVGLALFINKKYSKSLICFIVSSICFVYFRYWLIGIFGLSFLLSILVVKDVKPSLKRSLFVLGVIAGYYFARLVLAKFGVFSLSNLLGTIAFISQGWAGGGSGQELEIHSYLDLLLKMPWLMFTSLFRPLILEGRNMFQILAGIENTFLLIFSIVAVIKVIREKLWKNDLIKIFFIHIFIWTLIYAPISYQNLGTAERFKMQIIPFLLLFLYFSLKHKVVINRPEQTTALSGRE